MTPGVFLDMDGVMGAGRVWAQNAAKRWTCPASWVDPAMVARLNRLVRRTGARVVVSSSWRKYLGADGVAAVLAACGFAGEVLGATPVLPGDPPSWRGREIDRWLMAHPRVRDWVVLDDLAVSVDLGRLVRTDPRHGLTDDDVARAVAILGGR